ncbi:MAG: arylsulfatase [Burkholderiales bacterium]
MRLHSGSLSAMALLALLCLYPAQSGAADRANSDRTGADQAVSNQPNIVYILANDLGWKDVGYHGGAPATPNLDALAAAGARLERFYTEPFSTPTRAAIMTGRYPMRYGLQMQSLLPWSSYGLALDERLLPQALKTVGYRTAAFGQWQLGHASRDLLPTHRGFDYFYGNLNALGNHFRKTDVTGKRDWHRGERIIRERGYATQLIARDAAAYIADYDNPRPLFMYVSLPAAEAPLQAPADLQAPYQDVTDEQLRTYYAMVSAVDAAVGTIVNALKAKGMSGNTLIVFHSDNGGAVRHKFATGDGDVSHHVASNGPFRNGAGSMYEGAVRVVALAVWPGHIEPGVVSERIHVTDMYPTLLNLAHAPMDSDSQIKPIDGVDMWSVISRGELSPRKEILVHVDEFRGSIMIGNWKLIMYGSLPSSVELYNVADDPSEENNQAEKQPERVQQLLKRLNDYAWEMEPSMYLEDLAAARSYDTPTYWGKNPQRP